MVSLVDTHCHFDFADFDSCRKQLLQECQNNSIHQIIIPGVDPSVIKKSVALAEENAGIFFAVGLHPWFIQSFHPGSLESAIRAIARHAKCIAIGECGLDADIAVPMQQQLNVLKLHLLLAREMALPIILHNRKSNNVLLQLLDQYELKNGGVIHGFSGSYELAKQFVKRGFLIGVGGTITYERASKTRQAMANLPLTALVLETDAPDMPLSGMQGQQNSPIYLPTIAKQLAEIKNIPFNEVAAITTANAMQLFNLTRISHQLGEFR